MKKLLFTALLATAFGTAVADSYTIDPHHTNARFAADHNGTSTNVGGFFMLEGKVEFDATKKTGSVDIKIPMSKMNNGNAEFDEHLKAEGFFNAQKFPEMRFVSKKFVFDGDKVKSVEGDLTLLGQTKPVVLEATKFNCYHNKMANKPACGGDFKAKINPTDWGFKMPSDAEIKIQVEAFKD